MKKFLLLITTVSLVPGILVFANPAPAHHDAIYTPCDTTTGHVHMSFEEVSARISIMEQDGTIPAGMISRYNEERDGGKGNEDPRRVWARNLEEGQILSLGNWASGEHPELEQLMFNSGLVAEWQLDANKQVRRFDDPYWRQANPLSPVFTVWQSLCMANLGYSIPMFEVDDDGQWVSNIPSTTTTTTTTIAPVVTTTTTVPVQFDLDPAPAPEPELIPENEEPPVVHEAPSILCCNSLPTDYDLWDAEFEGWPFYETLVLLEERYPPNTPNRHHFRLSVAIEFLREGGMIGQLDRIWESGL